MPDVKWIKIVTDIFDDEKILLIETLPAADSIIVIWFKLLCLAGKQNNSGVFILNGRIPYTDKMLASIFRREESVIRLSLDTFAQFGMIEIVDNIITIPNWGKHQSLDQLENRKTFMRHYMQDYREKQKAIAECKPNSKPNSKPNVNCAEEDKNKKENKKDIGADKPPARKTFEPPLLEEITAYCSERKNNVNPERFYDFYSSKGWMVGKNKMKDWKACVRTWEKTEKQEVKPVEHKKLSGINYL